MMNIADIFKQFDPTIKPKLPANGAALDTYEFEAYLIEAEGGGFYVMVPGADYGRIVDINGTMEEEFDVKVVEWLVPVEQQPDFKAAAIEAHDIDSDHLSEVTYYEDDITPTWLLRVEPRK